jgi:glutamate---cysteine ligase / carboxylate-amine ligase
VTVIPSQVDDEAGRTVGVEEEFLLVDPESGRPVPWAAAVLAAAGPGGAVHAELFTTQVESVTGICRCRKEIIAQLRHGRKRLADAAAASDALLISAGTPVLSDGPVAPGRGPRFDRITRIYAGILADYQCCGCHVHVGVADRELAVGVVNHLAPWLPTLLALSANSPFEHGADTGHASWRMVLQSRFPGSGIAPWFGSAAEYDERVDQLVDCGVLADRRQSFWLARLSARYPTVEVRVADAAGTVAEATLQAMLSRALVRTALADLAAGRDAWPVDAQLAAAAVWTAARHGLGGPGIDLRTGRLVPARALLADLLTHVSPALEDLGDLDAVRAAVAAVRANGTGADRQRRAAHGGLLAVVRMLAARTLENPIGEP